MKITPATRGDETAAIALWADSGLTRPWNDANDDFVRAVEGVNSAVLIAYAGYYLAVAEASRGSGVGAALLHVAEDCVVLRRTLSE